MFESGRAIYGLKKVPAGFSADFCEADALPPALRGHLAVLASRDRPCVAEVAGIAVGQGTRVGGT